MSQAIRIAHDAVDETSRSFPRESAGRTYGCSAIVLKPASKGVSLIVCSTCRRRDTVDGRTTPDAGGERLWRILMERRAADLAAEGIAIEAMACLFGCQSACMAYLRGPDRVGYMLGTLDPDAATGDALLAFAKAYSASHDGRVPYELWPDGVKGHFLVRVPPEGRLIVD